MSLNGSPVELTTAATDVVLSLVCVGVVLGLTRPRVHDPWKTTLWSWVFVLLAVASAIGAVVHGFELTESVQAVLWSLLYLFLELTVALFFGWCGKRCVWQTCSTAVSPVGHRCRSCLPRAHVRSERRVSALCRLRGCGHVRSARPVRPTGDQRSSRRCRRSHCRDRPHAARRAGAGQRYLHSACRPL